MTKLNLTLDKEGGEKADLSYANLHYANFSYANFSYANLHYADFSSANFSYANLHYADFSSANLSSANLHYADFSSANLSSANLHYADFSSANLSSANGFKFRPLQLVNTRFFATIMDDHVLWGCRKMTFEELKKFELKDCAAKWEADEFKLNKKILTEMIRYYRKPQDQQS